MESKMNEESFDGPSHSQHQRMIAAAVAAAAAAPSATPLTQPQPSVKVKQEPIVESQAVEPAAAAPAAPAAAAAPSAPALPTLSNGEYADRIADSLAHMLLFTQNESWRLRMLHELGVESAEQARVRIRKMLEEILQLHEPPPAIAAAAAPASATAIKKQENAIKQENSSENDPSRSSSNSGSSIQVKRESMPSSSSFGNLSGSFSSPLSASASLLSSPSTNVASSASAFLASSPSSSSFAFGLQRARSFEPLSPAPAHVPSAFATGIDMHAAYAAQSSSSSAYSSSVAPMSLCTDEAFDSPTAPPPPTPAAAAAFVPRVLPKRSAAEMFK